MATQSLRDKIKAADDLTTEVVDVPEWGVQLALRSPSGKERARLVSQFVDDNGKPKLDEMYPAILIATARDPETNEPVFTADDASWINEKAGSVLERVAGKAMTVAGIVADPEASQEAGKDASTTTQS